jgi:hypothetical protein
MEAEDKAVTHVLDYPLARRLAKNGVPVARVLYLTKIGSKVWTTAWWAYNEQRDEYCWHRIFDDFGPLGNVIDVDQPSMDSAAVVRNLTPAQIDW